MLARSWSAAIHGVDIKTVEVEVNVTGAGQDTMIQMVGLPDTVVRESRERVWSALYESGFRPPPGRTTI
ncbi:MAG: magnesium chelatase, partial [Lentisphaerae bacterium]|nr:magnesium chelatase [Lentisphaerota bacterium]